VYIITTSAAFIISNVSMKHVKFSDTVEVFDIPCENAGWHIRDCVKHVPCKIKFVSSEVKKRRRASQVRIAEELE